MLGVHAVPGEPGHVELTGPGLSDAARAVEVHFGPRTRARVVRRTQHGVVCAVPPSEYAGIGYATRVRLRVRVQRPHGRRGGWTDAVFANASRAWWTYAATVPPTRVANVATALVWRSGDAQLLRVLRLFADRLGRDWRIQLFVHPDVAPAFRDDAFVAAELESGRLEITPRARLSYVQLARAQLDPAYWEPVHGDRILVVQGDAVPCSHTPYHISDFYNDSYVGAPWCYFSVRGGNSGLSLRNKTTIINMLRDHKDVFDAYLANPAFVMEDVAICLSFLSCLSLPLFFMSSHTHTHVVLSTGEVGTKYNLGFAPKDVGLKFSVETQYSPTPWGVHQPWSGTRGRDWAELLKSCPEIKIILPKQYKHHDFGRCVPGV